MINIASQIVSHQYGRSHHQPEASDKRNGPDGRYKALFFLGLHNAPKKLSMGTVFIYIYIKGVK